MRSSRATRLLRYRVTGPGLEASYDAPGPALSRALTAAERSQEDATFYVRDAIGEAILGYAERIGKLTVTVRHKEGKHGN